MKELTRKALTVVNKELAYLVIQLNNISFNDVKDFNELIEDIKTLQYAKFLYETILASDDIPSLYSFFNNEYSKCPVEEPEYYQNSDYFDDKARYNNFEVIENLQLLIQKQLYENNN